MPMSLEERRERRAQRDLHRAIFADVYAQGRHDTMRLEVCDLEELIVRCGWTVTDHLRYPDRDSERAARVELARLESLPYLTANTREQGVEWWYARLWERKRALTPDM